MVVEVTNPDNNPMHYGDWPAVKIVSAPDKLPNRVLYTNVEANRVYNDLQYDIYKTQKEHNRLLKKPKTKTLILVLSSLGVIALGIIFRKNIINFSKNLVDKIKNLKSHS